VPQYRGTVSIAIDVPNMKGVSKTMYSIMKEYVFTGQIEGKPLQSNDGRLKAFITSFSSKANAINAGDLVSSVIAQHFSGEWTLEMRRNADGPNAKVIMEWGN